MTETVANAPAINLAVKRTRPELCKALLDHAGIEVSVSAVYRAQISGRLAYATIKNGMRSSVQDYLDMVAEDTRRDMERRGITKPSASKRAEASRDEWEAQARMYQAAITKESVRRGV